MIIKIIVDVRIFKIHLRYFFAVKYKLYKRIVAIYLNKYVCLHDRRIILPFYNKIINLCPDAAAFAGVNC